MNRSLSEMAGLCFAHGKALSGILSDCHIYYQITPIVALYSAFTVTLTTNSTTEQKGDFLQAVFNHLIRR